MVRLYINNGKCGVEEYYKIIGTEKKTMVYLSCYKMESATYQELKRRLGNQIDEPAMAKILSDFVASGILEKLKFNALRAEQRTIYRITQKGVDLYPVLNLMENYCHKWEYMFNSETCEWMTFSKKLLGSRWNNRIIWVLFVLRSVRFNDLKGSIEGISFKILAEKLQFLEKEGVVNRIDFDENPPHTEYSLTLKGADLYNIILLIAEWDAHYNRRQELDVGRSGVKLRI